MIQIQQNQVYQLHDPAHLYDEMLRDLKLLWDGEAFASGVTLIVCFVDCFAGGTKKTFVPFVEKHFPDLCAELRALRPKKKGGTTFYDEFRNGMAHMRGPKTGFCLARDSETQGKHVVEVEIEGDATRTRYIGISVDRLHADFLALVEHMRPKA